MARLGEFDFQEFKELAKRLQKAVDDQAMDTLIREFLLEMAYRAVTKIKNRTPVNTGDLRRKWMVGRVEKTGNNYQVEIFNLLEYASFIEKGFRAHWVPGEWEGKIFKYIPGAKTGMQVGKKGGWVEGRFMVEISMQEMKQEFPAYLERKQAQFLRDLFG
ncbi:HK97 gp10 family phage protein [Desulforamulus ruminis]|uniref:HK97 gp10 family phage protein n=1 Tax=Desulforamulus ruminis TaxID=1564 RepID=UPI002352178D|nr:HK97 gp10 family phage protein [Desulforamulus ruminis]